MPVLPDLPTVHVHVPLAKRSEKSDAEHLSEIGRPVSGFRTVLSERSDLVCRLVGYMNVYDYFETI